MFLKVYLKGHKRDMNKCLKKIRGFDNNNHIKNENLISYDHKNFEQKFEDKMKDILIPDLFE